MLGREENELFSEQKQIIYNSLSEEELIDDSEPEKIESEITNSCT